MRVAPVVSTSSTSRVVTPRMLARHLGGTSIARSRLSARCLWSRPAWSATRRRSLSADETTSSRSERPTRRTAARVNSSSGASPRRRTAAGDEGTGTTNTGPLPDARTARRCGSPASAAAIAPDNIGARTATRSRRSPSLNATSAARTAASYEVAAQVGGYPAGQGVGQTCLAPPGQRDWAVSSAHTMHQVAPDAPHPPHVVGSASSRVARSERRAKPTRVMHTRLPAMTQEEHFEPAGVDGGVTGRWAVHKMPSRNEPFGGHGRSFCRTM